MSKRIYAVRNENTVSLFVDGKQHYIDCANIDEAKELIQLAQKAKESDNEETYKELLVRLDPSHKLEYLEQGEGKLKLIRNRSGEIFLENTSIPLPKLIVDAIVNQIEDDIPYDHLINFWSLCLQNPNPQAREDLFKFLSTYNFPITDYGYFIGYKAVYFKGEKNRYLLEGLSKILIDSKISRQDLSKVYVYRNDYHSSLYSVIADNKGESINKLDEIIKQQLTQEYLEADYRMYLNSLDDESDQPRYDEPDDEDIKQHIENHYEVYFKQFDLYCMGDRIMEKISNLLGDDEADAFTDIFTQKMDIRLGFPVSMPREDCDDNPDQVCSSGLHIGAPGYVRGFGGGSTKAIIACLVNPADVVAVPKDYSYMKMRTAKYFPYVVCELDKDGGVVEIDAKYFEEDYCDYEIKELENIQDEAVSYNGLSSEEAKQLIKNRLVVLQS